MQTRFVVNFDFRTKNDEIQFSEIINHFNFIIAQIDEFSKHKRDWYETGYSRKQALSQLAFRNGDILDNTRSKWERRYKKTILYLLMVCGMQMMTATVVESPIEKCTTPKKTGLR